MRGSSFSVHRPGMNEDTPMRFTPLLLSLLAGPLAWAAHFVFVYALNGVFCARPALHGLWAEAGLAAWVILGAALAATGLIGWVNWRQRRRWPRTDDAGFFPWLAGALGLLSALAIFWQSVPVLWIPACAAG